MIHVVLGISYAISTLFFAALPLFFRGWQRSEGTLSIHSIYTMRRELFHWATVSTTLTLGTAAGDPTAVVFALPAIAYWKFGLSEIAAFWAAYVVTKPFGAPFADWMGVATERGGLNWGTGPVSLVLTLLIFAMVGYASLTEKRIEN